MTIVFNLFQLISRNQNPIKFAKARHGHLENMEAFEASEASASSLIMSVQR